MIRWLFRALCVALFAWLCFDRKTDKMNWLLLTACICFFILGTWMRARADQRRRSRHG